MDANLAGPLISAGASIVVALIGLASKGTRPMGSGQAPGGSIQIPARNTRAWLTLSILSAVGTTLAIFTLHHDAAAMAILLIPLAGLILAFTRPVRPTTAAAFMLLLAPLGFAAEPLDKMLHGLAISNHLDSSSLAVVLGSSVSAAILIALVAWWRAPRVTSSPLPDSGERPKQSSPSGEALASQLAKLSVLHASGALDDDEFARAKKKLLSD